MKVAISTNKKHEEMIVTLQNYSSRDQKIFSNILTDYSNRINNDVEFQTIHTSIQWTFFLYTIDKLDVLSKELEQIFNNSFGKQVVEIREYE